MERGGRQMERICFKSEHDAAWALESKGLPTGVRVVVPDST